MEQENLIKYIGEQDGLQVKAICDFLGITDSVEIPQCPECYNLDVRNSDSKCNKCDYQF